VTDTSTGESSVVEAPTSEPETSGGAAAKPNAPKTGKTGPVQPARTGGLFGRNKSVEPEPQTPAVDAKARAPKPGAKPVVNPKKKGARPANKPRS